MPIQRAEKDDLPAILKLQYSAYQSEAELLGHADIPPLKQTIEDIENEFKAGVFLKLTDENNIIIGSIRACLCEKTLFIGKLMVHPDHRGQGLGTKLLAEIEKTCPHERCELFTSSESRKNIRLYQRAGYKIFREQELAGNLKFVYLEKPSALTK